jgi:hypothetical protein
MLADWKLYAHSPAARDDIARLIKTLTYRDLEVSPEIISAVWEFGDQVLFESLVHVAMPEGKPCAGLRDTLVKLIHAQQQDSIDWNKR